MARNTATIVIDAAGRDHGKVFLLTELPALQAEKWAVRAFLAMSHNGIEIPEDIANSGLAGIASIGIKAIGAMAFRTPSRCSTRCSPASRSSPTRPARTSCAR